MAQWSSGMTLACGASDRSQGIDQSLVRFQAEPAFRASGPRAHFKNYQVGNLNGPLIAYLSNI